MSLTTLDGLENGTAVGLRINGRTQLWTVLDGGLLRDGHRLEPFFFTGFLEKGLLYLGDARPPEVGDWWREPGSDYYTYLILQLVDDNGRTYVAQYRHAEFYQFTYLRSVSEQYERHTPEWAPSGDQLVKMAQRAWTFHKDLTTAQERSRNMSRINDYARQIESYTSRIREMTTT